jgi:hypothetical protein
MAIVALHPGLPPGTDFVLQRVRKRTGSWLRVAAVGEPFSEGPEHLEVFLDELSVGTADFWWDDDEPAAQTLGRFREWLSWFLDPEFSNGWW